MNTDKDLWRENGLYSSSESDSGNSDFDDDYYELRPPYNPDEYRNSNIITLKRNQFSGDGGNILNIPILTPRQSEVMLDRKKTNVQSETKKTRKRRIPRKKKKPQNTTDEHQNVNSAFSNNVTDIRSNCKPYSGGDSPRGMINLMFNENYVTRNATHEAHQLETDSEENINTNFNNENNIIAIRNPTSEAYESHNSFDYSQYRDPRANKIATYYTNLENGASVHNINIEHPMPEKEITEKLQSRQQINSTHRKQHKNVIVEAIMEVIVFGLRPLETIFQELWNEFF